MGKYTANNYFYKPAYGSSGKSEKQKFDDALDYADSEIYAGSSGSTGYTDSDAISAINNDLNHGSTASHNYASLPDDVGLGNVPNEDATNPANMDQAGANDGQSIIWNDTLGQWEPGDVSSSGFSGDPSDLNQEGASDGDRLAWNDSLSQWEPSAGTSSYTDSDAISAINTDSDHGSTAPHNYFSGDHADLTNITADQHHTKYTDSEASNAAPVQSVNGNTGSVNLDYTDVGAASDSHNHDATYLNELSNLSDLPDKATSRSNLGLGSASERTAEDSLTDSDNLPDGHAIKIYGDTNWSNLEGFVQPEDFGAAGDGVTDDRAALQSAFDDGRTVILKHGSVYSIGSTQTITYHDDSTSNNVDIDVGIVPPDFGVCLFGNNAKIVADTTMDALIVFQDRNSYGTWNDIRLDCNDNATVGYLHNDNDTSQEWSPYLVLRRFRVENYTDCGIIVSTFTSQFDHLVAAGNSASPGAIGIAVVSPGFYVRRKLSVSQTPEALAATSVLYNNCYTLNSEHGYYSDRLIYSSFNACACDACSYAYNFEGSCEGLSMNGCGCERCAMVIKKHGTSSDCNITINGFKGVNLGMQFVPDYFFKFYGNSGSIIINSMNFTQSSSPNEKQYAIVGDGTNGPLLYTTQHTVDGSRQEPTVAKWSGGEWAKIGTIQ